MDHHDALIPAYQQRKLEQLNPLVMQGSLPPAFDDQFGHQDRDLAIRMVMLNFQNVLDKRHDHKAVR